MDIGKLKLTRKTSEFFSVLAIYKGTEVTDRETGTQTHTHKHTHTHTHTHQSAGKVDHFI